MATEEQHAAAVIAALNAVGAHAYDYDDLPATRPDFYTEVTVSQRFGGERRHSGERDGELYRITARSVAKTVTNARLLRTKAKALIDTPLTVASATTTPVEFETADPIGPDDGWYSGLLSLTYALI